MFWSLAPLVLGCILLAGMVGMCSFAPRGTNQGQIPTYDVATALRADAATLGFPIRLPQLPAGWQPNSGGRGGIENGRTDPSTGQRLNAATSIVGYISPTGMYLSLTQSNADEDKLVGLDPPVLSFRPERSTSQAPTGSSIKAPAKAGRTPSRSGPPGLPARPAPPRSRSPVPAAPTSSVRWPRRHNRSRRFRRDS